MGRRKWGPMITLKSCLPHLHCFPLNIFQERNKFLSCLLSFYFFLQLYKVTIITNSNTTFTFLDKTVKKLDLIKIVLKYVTWEKQVSFKVESIKDHTILCHSQSCVRCYFLKQSLPLVYVCVCEKG